MDINGIFGYQIDIRWWQHFFGSVLEEIPLQFELTDPIPGALAFCIETLTDLSPDVKEKVRMHSLNIATAPGFTDIFVVMMYDHARWLALFATWSFIYCHKIQLISIN